MKTKRTLWRAVGAAAIIALIGFGVAGCDSPTNNHAPAPPPADRTELAAAIAAAEALLAATRESANGSDLPTTEYWTTAQVRDTFAAALVAALDVYEDDDATQDDVDDAIETLTAAHAVFYESRERGTFVTAVDRTALGDAITAADALLEATRESADGDEVPVTARWTNAATLAAAHGIFYAARLPGARRWQAPALPGMVSAGLGHAVAIREDGSLWGWGSVDSGGITSGGSTTPQRVDDAYDWAHVSAGQNHTMAIRADGSL